MRTVITDRLSYGNESECTHSTDGSIAVVHACKHPCHRHAVGYTNTLPNTHPNYLVLERGHHLYLNLIDPPAPPTGPELPSPALREQFRGGFGDQLALVACARQIDFRRLA